MDRPDWSKPPVKGYLYAVEFEDGAVKIGYTRHATQRFHTLQNYYRGYRSRIVRTFISAETNDCRFDEYKATYGLRPREKREIFPVSFWAAIDRIVSVVGDEDDELFITCTRHDTLREFPCLAQ